MVLIYMLKRMFRMYLIRKKKEEEIFSSSSGLNGNMDVILYFRFQKMILR